MMRERSGSHEQHWPRGLSAAAGGVQRAYQQYGGQALGVPSKQCTTP